MQRTYLHIKNWNQLPVKISIGAFAEDVVIVAKSGEELQNGLNEWNGILTTKVMVIGRI